MTPGCHNSFKDSGVSGCDMAGWPLHLNNILGCPAGRTRLAPSSRLTPRREAIRLLPAGPRQRPLFPTSPTTTEAWAKVDDHCSPRCLRPRTRHPLSRARVNYARRDRSRRPDARCPAPHVAHSAGRYLPPTTVLEGRTLWEGRSLWMTEPGPSRVTSLGGPICHPEKASPSPTVIWPAGLYKAGQTPKRRGPIPGNPRTLTQLKEPVCNMSTVNKKEQGRSRSFTSP